MCLIILRRVRYIIIVLQRLGIPAPFCVHIDRDLAGLRLFGGNHDHTVGSSGAIKSIGSRVLQDGHRLYIIGVEIIHISGIRHAIHYVKRFGPGIY